VQLDIVTPERRVHSLKSSDVNLPCTVDSVAIPGLLGQFEVLPGHAPFVTMLGTGLLTFHVAGRKVDIMISGGFCEVDRDSVNILCEKAALREEIERSVEEEAHTRFQRDLASLGAVSEDDENYQHLKSEVDQAATKLTLIK
jgi:F-type H+-transporting ATPase subunit epsilon